MCLEDLEAQQRPPLPQLLRLQQQQLLRGKLVEVQEDQAVVLEIRLAWDMVVALEDLEVVVHTSNIINSKVTSPHHCSISNKDHPLLEVALTVAVVVATVLLNINNSNTTAHQHPVAVGLPPLYLMVVDQVHQTASMEVAADHLMVVVVELRCLLDHHLLSVLVVGDSVAVALEAIAPVLDLRPLNNHHSVVNNFMVVVVVAPCLLDHHLANNSR